MEDFKSVKTKAVAINDIVKKITEIIELPNITFCSINNPSIALSREPSGL